MGGTEQTDAEDATVCSGEGLHTETRKDTQTDKESSRDTREVKDNVMKSR